MPVPAQNSANREYVVRRGGEYVLPPLESIYSNCFHYLFDLLIRVPLNANIVMYSVLMLPPGDKLSDVFSFQKKEKYQFCFCFREYYCL